MNEPIRKFLHLTFNNDIEAPHIYSFAVPLRLSYKTSYLNEERLIIPKLEYELVGRLSDGEFVYKFMGLVL